METVFWRNFTRLCEAHWTTPNAVARKLGIPSGAVAEWKQDAFPTIPRGEVLQKIADRFRVTVQDLVSGEPIDAETLRFMKLLKRASPEKRRAVLILLECTPNEEKNDAPKTEMQERIYEAAEVVTDIIRHYSESSAYLATSAEVVVQAATALAELAKVATK